MDLQLAILLAGTFCIMAWAVWDLVLAPYLDDDDE